MSSEFFTISFRTINLFSFMLGMTFAFFKQGLFGKRIGIYIITYFAGLAAWYGALYYEATHNVVGQPTTQITATQIKDASK